MQIPINTEPLKALDVPTRWLLSTALDRAATEVRRESSQIQIVKPEYFGHLPAARRGLSRDEAIAELDREAEVYRQISEAIR